MGLDCSHCQGVATCYFYVLPSLQCDSCVEGMAWRAVAIYRSWTGSCCHTRGGVLLPIPVPPMTEYHIEAAANSDTKSWNMVGELRGNRQPVARGRRFRCRLRSLYNQPSHTVMNVQYLQVAASPTSRSEVIARDLSRIRSCRGGTLTFRGVDSNGRLCPHQ